MPRHLSAVADPPADEARVEPITVVLAERHAPMRRTLGAVIDAEGDLVLVDDPQDLESAEVAIHGSRSSVLVVDRGLLDRRVLDSVARLCERVLPARVIVLSSEMVPSLADRIVSAGASGFVLKERADVELPEAVRAAARGRAFISGAVRPARASAEGFPAHSRGVLRIASDGRGG